MHKSGKGVIQVHNENRLVSLFERRASFLSPAEASAAVFAEERF